MHESWRIVAIASVIAAAVLWVTTLHAESTLDKDAPYSDHGGMMSRPGQTRQMMEGCSSMMGVRGGRSERPNDRWRKSAPGAPEKKS